MTTEESIRRLEAEAGRVLRKVRRSRRRKPLFVEFSGTPKAGKSTIISSLRLFLARNDFRPFVLTERASTCPIRSKVHPFFNVWTACATLIHMLDAGQPGQQRDDVVIMDRGLFDSLVWMRWLVDRGQLDDEERAAIERFITLDQWRKMIDVVFIMKVSPDIALTREFSGLVTLKPGSIMNKKTITEFNDALEATIVDYEVEFSPLLRIDTTGQKPEDTSHEVVQRTLEALDNL